MKCHVLYVKIEEATIDKTKHDLFMNEKHFYFSLKIKDKIIHEMYFGNLTLGKIICDGVYKGLSIKTFCITNLWS